MKQKKLVIGLFITICLAIPIAAEPFPGPVDNFSLSDYSTCETVTHYLSWDNENSSDAAYVVNARRTDGLWGGYVVYPTNCSATCNYSFTDLIVGDTYLYRIKQFNLTTLESGNYTEELSLVAAFGNCAPTMDACGFVPLSPGTGDDLQIYAEASDADGDNVSFYVNVYQDGVLNKSYDLQYEYQEGPDQYSCTSGFDPNKPATNGFDGDFTTRAKPFSRNHPYCYFNYSLNNPAFYQTKHDYDYGATSALETNNNSVLGCKTSPLETKVLLVADYPTYYTSVYCNNGSEWVYLYGSGNQTLPTGAFYFYEEAVWSRVVWPESSLAGPIISISSNDTAKHQNWSVSCLAYDGSSNSSWLNSSNITIQNTPPEISDVYVQPASAQSGDNLSYTYVFSDADNDLPNQNSSAWYLNGVRVSALDNASTVLMGNTSLGDTWEIELRVFDGENWSNAAVKSPGLVIGDTSEPTFYADRLSDNSGQNDQPFTIYVNVSELNDVAYVKVEVADPNGAKTNYSMSPGTAAGQHTKTYAPGVDGVYTFTFYAMDGSSNQAKHESTLEYLESTYTGSSGGGGGGSQGVTTDDVKDLITNATKGYVAISYPGTTIKVGPPPRTKPFTQEIVVVAKEGDAEATVRLSDSLKAFVSAEICDPYTLMCGDEVFIEDGQQKYVLLVGDLSSDAFTKEFDEKGVVTGYFEVLSGGVPGPTKYEVSFEKTWLYDESAKLGETLGVPHKTVHGALLGGVALLALGIVAAIFAAL